MPRKRIIWTENKVNKFIKDGRGQGEGADYIPWIKVGEFSSLGRSHRIRDIHNGRIHHFFSDLEKDYYYILMWNDEITDIREQYPLFPIMDTEEIATKLGVKHPQHNGFNLIMTTDFLISTSKQMYARSIKLASDLMEKRTKEKLKIEELYWKKRNIDFKVVTEESFSRITAKNIEKLFGYYEYSFEGILKEEQENLSQGLMQSILYNENKTVSQICTIRDLKNNMKQGSHLSLFWHLAARKNIPLYINDKLLATRKVNQIVEIEILKQKVKEKVHERFA